MVVIIGMITDHQGKKMQRITMPYKKHGDEKSYDRTAKRFPEDFDDEKFM